MQKTLCLLSCSKEPKNIFSAKGYSFYNLTRTIILICFFTFIDPLNQRLPWWFVIKVYFLVIVQTLYTIVIAVIKPFDKTQTNLIQIWNEFIFTILSWFLIYYNKVERWNSTIEEVYIRIITSNSFTTLFIILCKN